MPDSEAGASDAVRVEGLRFAWPGAERPLLAIDELRVPRGARVFLRGPSGSGKSTLLALIGGVLTPGSGLLRVLGTDMAGLSRSGRDRFRADHVGFVFQQFNLLPYLDVVGNVLLASRFSRRRRGRLGADPAAAARACLAELGLEDPTLLRRPVTELSTGQQQRVAAARALLGEPGLVIADEPTSSLDAEARGAFMRLLFRECARTGATLLFVSHDPALAGGFDEVIELPVVNQAGSAAR
jgi:putative ABC transport system ATP-binding protein